MLQRDKVNFGKSLHLQSYSENLSTDPAECRWSQNGTYLSLDEVRVSSEIVCPHWGTDMPNVSKNHFADTYLSQTWKQIYGFYTVGLKVSQALPRALIIGGCLFIVSNHWDLLIHHSIYIHIYIFFPLWFLKVSGPWDSSY